MVKVLFHPAFQKTFEKIKNASIKEKIIKHIQKLKDSPDLGKPMMYNRKGTRELYIEHYRLSYSYLKDEDKIVIIEFYHKDEQ